MPIDFAAIPPYVLYLGRMSRQQLALRTFSSKATSQHGLDPLFDCGLITPPQLAPALPRIMYNLLYLVLRGSTRIPMIYRRTGNIECYNCTTVQMLSVLDNEGQGH